MNSKACCICFCLIVLLETWGSSASSNGEVTSITPAGLIRKLGIIDTIKDKIKGSIPGYPGNDDDVGDKEVIDEEDVIDDIVEGPPPPQPVVVTGVNYVSDKSLVPLNFNASGKWVGLHWQSDRQSDCLFWSIS